MKLSGRSKIMFTNQPVVFAFVHTSY